MRIGQGYDVHALVQGRKLVVGGVTIPFEKGLAGHSDADVLIHAVCDALLGAAALGDIGLHFPDSDSQWKDADSMQLLARVVWLAHERGFVIGNVDATVMLEQPKLREHIDAMRDNLARTLNADKGCVSVKAKTGEGLDAVGRGEAVRAHAVVLLKQISVT